MLCPILKTTFTATQLVLALALTILIVSPQALALQEVTIKDTSGTVRNVTQIDEAANIEFSLTDAHGLPAQGAEVSLKNELTGEILKITAQHGTALFEGVQPGAWVVASSTSSITFTNIAVTSSAAIAASGAAAATGATFLGTGAMVGGGALVIGGTALAISESTDSSSDGSDDDDGSNIIPGNPPTLSPSE